MSRDDLNVSVLGQVFTPKRIVSDMISLIRNHGNILEPSCGNGAFFSQLDNCTGIEIDPKVAPQDALCMDFFDFSTENKFDTIIGNPPYVRYQDISLETKKKLDKTLFDERSNLYLFFIHKCIQHLKPKGELIFIVPRDFLKSTSSIRLNEFIYKSGTITDIIELGDEKIFTDAAPNCIIFRFEKDNFSRKTNITQNFNVINGQIFFTNNRYRISFSDIFFVKVGAVSGADPCFESKNGTVDFVCSKTRKDGTTKKMFYNEYSPELEKHKTRLIQRKIKPFTEDNWFMWGRNYYKSDQNRIYVNGKTRVKNPFFYNDCKAYDGSILAIFPKFDASVEECKQMAELLNQVNWEELGFVCDGRYLFSQRALENSVLPDTFEIYLSRTMQIGEAA